MDYTPPTLDEVEKDLSFAVTSAVDFIQTEYAGEWADAQRYYNGESGVPKVAGRSQVTSTNVRDAIRNVRPSLLRIFLHAESIVEFIPNGVAQQHLAYVQSRYVNDLFFKAGGYKALYSAIQNAALKKVGVLMYWWDDTPSTSTFELTGIPAPELEKLQALPDVSITALEEVGAFPAADTMIPLYNCVVEKLEPNGQIRLRSVPLHEFIIDENATCIEDAEVVGHRRNVTVAEAIKLGLSAEQLEGLDSYDAEEDIFTEESHARRGYSKSRAHTPIDPMARKVLITCVFYRVDLEGTGVPQLYRFYLGGTRYKYLTHERVQRANYAAICLDFEPDTFFGKSIYDVQKQEQDTMTSILRATCDNAHLSNNRRLAVHEQLVNLDDVLNNSIGAPIRVRSPGQIQEIGVQSSVGAMLPLLQYLQQNSEVKVGVTSAAMGLDHDALQSTTREAAKNTIQLSQGQIEVMARNIAEGLTSLFAGLLDLSLRHMQPEQMLYVNGEYVQIDQTTLNPRLAMRPNVGLGTGRNEDKIMGLNFVLAQQKEMVAAYGPTNPIASVQHVYNTLEDIAKLHGLHNVSRYFAPMTQEVMQQLQQIMQQQAENAPVDPAKAMIQVEQIKADLRKEEKRLEFMLDQRDKAVERRIRALEFAAKDDLERDKLAQQLYGSDAQMTSGKGLPSGVDVEAVKREQAKPRPAMTDAGITEANGNE